MMKSINIIKKAILAVKIVRNLLKTDLENAAETGGSEKIEMIPESTPGINRYIKQNGSWDEKTFFKIPEFLIAGFDNKTGAHNKR